MRTKFGNSFLGLHVSPGALVMKLFFITSKTIPLSRTLEVDISKSLSSSDLITVGINYIEQVGEGGRVRLRVLPYEDARDLYAVLELYNYPVKEFWEPYRMSRSRQKLEGLLKTRSSLREIAPSELQQELL